MCVFIYVDVCVYMCVGAPVSGAPLVRPRLDTSVSVPPLELSRLFSAVYLYVPVSY